MTDHPGPGPVSVDDLLHRLRRHGYLADRNLGMTFLAIRMGRPLLLEGAAGVGKTALATTLAPALDTDLIRLQCYEGIDASQALYEWDYPRQLLRLRAMEARGDALDDVETDLYTERLLLERPLLRALRAERRPVLLIDEVDRADDEFEAFLLELLADFQVTIPELGVVRATTPPVVALTSNRTRELHDALRRRCLYHWIDHPTVEREAEIIALRAPHVGVRTAVRVAEVVARIRTLDLDKPPGVAESIDWANALRLLDVEDLDEAVAADTLGTVVKDYDDLERTRLALAELL